MEIHYSSASHAHHRPTFLRNPLRNVKTEAQNGKAEASLSARLGVPGKLLLDLVLHGTPWVGGQMLSTVSGLSQMSTARGNAHLQGLLVLVLLV